MGSGLCCYPSHKKSAERLINSYNKNDIPNPNVNKQNEKVLKKSEENNVIESYKLNIKNGSSKNHENTKNILKISEISEIDKKVNHGEEESTNEIDVDKNGGGKKIQKELNIGNGAIKQIDIMINNKKCKESQLKNEIEKLTEEIKEINDLLFQNLQKEKDIQNEIKKYNLLLEEKEKEYENKINLLKNRINIFEQEKSQFNIKNNELLMKENKIKNREAQLNLREIKIKEKEKELIEREFELQKKENKYKIVLIGLNNIGATCYMNATLQCLSNSKKLTEYFLEQFKKDTNKIMTNEYYEVLKNLWNVDSKEKAYSPNSFKEVLSKENPLFAGVAANDSKDLINFLLERFHQELNIINANNNLNNNNSNFNQPDQTNEIAMLGEFLQEYVQKFNSPISDLFYGILETKSQCQGCNIIKYNFQVYSFLEFPLQQVNQFYFNNGKRPLLTNDGKNPDVDLYECFEYNRKIDLMTGENQMYCNICNKLCNAYYSTILYSGPNYLIINLNRGKGAIYECKVNFPNQLNIFNYVSFKNGITVYELYAVICHLGPSSMSGHFVAYCKNRIDNQWYLYNDGIVTKCSRQFQYNDGMPYILFYRGLSSD